MTKLGYTDFISKHKTKALIIFVASILLVFLHPIFYDKYIFRIPNSAMNLSFFVMGVKFILFPIQVKSSYLYNLNNYFIKDTSFADYFKPFISYYVLYLIGSLIFWFIIIAIIILLVQHFKHKKVCKPLLYLPLSFYILYIVIECTVDKAIPFIGFYLAIILEVLVILYCAGFQRFPARKPREHKPTDKERIAELERQVEELRKEKDAE